MAAHAVGYDVEALLIIAKKRVLVDLAPTTDVGSRNRDEPQSITATHRNMAAIPSAC
jgi:hypothetical protein